MRTLAPARVPGISLLISVLISALISGPAAPMATGDPKSAADRGCARPSIHLFEGALVAAANKNQTKAAKAVARAAGGAVSVGEGLRLLTPLNGGKHAYVNSGGRSVHVATGGAAFLDVVRDLAGNGQESRIRTELALLAQEYPQSSWPTVRERVEAELFAPAAESDESDDEAAA
jgi:hypothetical protein